MDKSFQLIPQQNSNLIRIPIRITRSFVVNHHELIFLYAHDFLRKGCFGQAWSLHGEPNTYPIFTMYKYCANPVYFSDSDYWFIEVNKTFELLPKDKGPIIPCRKIGKGCSRMQEFAPKLLTHIQNKLAEIAHKDIEWYEET